MWRIKCHHSEQQHGTSIHRDQTPKALTDTLVPLDEQLIDHAECSAIYVTCHNTVQ